MTKNHDDNPKDEEDLKIKTTSKEMRMISKIENDPKVNENPTKNGSDVKMKTI